MCRSIILVSLALGLASGCDNASILMDIDRMDRSFALHITPCAAPAIGADNGCGTGQDVFSEGDSSLEKSVGIYIKDGSLMPVLQFNFRGAVGQCQPMTVNRTIQKTPHFKIHVSADTQSPLTIESCTPDICSLGNVSIDCRG